MYFAGGVEAAASSNGQIMPLVMRVAAFVLVALTAVPYTKVITAAFIPAMAFFFSIFLAVVFQARKERVAPMREFPEDLVMARPDWTNLIIIFGPILTSPFLLLGNKDAVRTGVLSTVLGPDSTILQTIIIQQATLYPLDGGALRCWSRSCFLTVEHAPSQDG